MTHRIGNVVVIMPQDPEKCELCGAVDECRPYGPKGENICFDCGMKHKETTNAAIEKLMG